MCPVQLGRADDPSARSFSEAVRICPVQAPLGAALLLACDSIGRIVARPAEMPTGIVLALIGGPAFLALIGRVAR